MEGISDLQKTIWGNANDVDQKVFERWLQGFVFSDVEPVALVQKAGGPCGILAPVQAQLLRIRMFPQDEEPQLPWRSQENVYESLMQTLVHMLLRTASRTDLDSSQPRQIHICCIDDIEIDKTLSSFHEHISLQSFESAEEAEAILLSLLPQYKSEFGILLYLYSIIATRGTASIAEDMSFDSEPLITMPHGHASQALLNLLLTGTCSPEVFNGEKDMGGGFMIHGVSERSEVGFITLLESLHLCSVGSNLKSPQHPIWVLGSESHFSVVFSHDRRLTDDDNPLTAAKRKLSKYDPANQGFAQATELEAILKDLGEKSSPQDVVTVRSAVDPEHLGIVLFPKLLSHLYPDVRDTGTPQTFTIYHYNGVPLAGREVKFHRGVAKAQDASDFGATDFLRTLRTKWRDVVIEWPDGDPSIQ